MVPALARHTLFALVSALLFGVVLLGESVAQAQPQITPVPLSLEVRRLNIAEVNTNTPIELDWTVGQSLNGPLRYEVTYDRARTENDQTVPLVVLDDVVDAGEAEGPVIFGQRALIRIRPQQILPETALPSAGGAAAGKRSIVLRVFVAAQPYAQLSSASYTWEFEYDTQAPQPPAITQILPGEKRLEVQWTASASIDVSTYQILFCPNVLTGTVTEASILAGGTLPCAEPNKVTGIGENLTSKGITEGLLEGQTAAVAMRAVDDFGNDGSVGAVALGTPTAVTDFFEAYRAEGGAEDGGYCFVATAAYGSYAHPVVRILRWYRDAVLASLPGGEALIAAYYRHSPPLARRIAASPALAAVARLALLPITALAFLALLLPLAPLLWIARARRRAAVALVGLGLLVAEEARAARPPPELPVGLGFEFKGGPYLPALGDPKSPTRSQAFKDIFGEETNPLYGLGAELQLLRGYGTLAIGGSFGFMQFVGRSLYASGEKSTDTTVFNILPLNLVATYRLDFIPDLTGIPFSPYVRGGLAYHLWWVTTGTGDTSVVTDPSGGELRGRGGKLGLTGTVGVSLLLNALEPRSAQHLYNSTGVRGTYLFGEVQASQVDDFGEPGFDLSDLTWNVGIFFEL